MGHELAIDVSAAQQLLACNLCGARDHRTLFRKAGYDLVACGHCGLAFIANPPDEAAIAALYDGGADYHSALLDLGHATFARMQEIARQHLTFLRRSIAQPTGLRLLDIGCSSGLFLNEARTAGFVVSGAELSAATSAFARDHFGLDVHTGDWREAGHAPGSFDVITLFDVIEHLADPFAELVAIRRLLKPGGLLLQSTPDIDGLFPRLSYKLANRLDYWPHPEPPHHLFQFSRRTLAALTEKAGYKTLRADQTRIRLGYSFGTPSHWKRSPKMLAYAALFAGTALVGPWIGQGDWLYLASRNPV
ncbi:class I SAM-dependent methyltransferase [Novosphingobium sp. JCM 18896]|uniref:class I SAM-dependent methyltransferase n=1 Tax=Novosphingobium sp. JCM 18896 TaxID=2989731 RepID=UPI00222149A2|nr:class I SAM-dependent methyltransferase [Novosphingobium sp. JCM 18896]MCW1427979.1 class I SAM-dependent methyltransferase [Novosphingobium sp. JCM 18896]